MTPFPKEKGLSPSRITKRGVCGISRRFQRLFPAPGQVPTRYSPVRHSVPRPKPGSSFDLHVLSMPPAFVLSQDQTLMLNPRNTQAQLHQSAPGSTRAVTFAQTFRNLEKMHKNDVPFAKQHSRNRRPHIPSNKSQCQRANGRGKIHALKPQNKRSGPMHRRPGTGTDEGIIPPAPGEHKAVKPPVSLTDDMSGVCNM